MRLKDGIAASLTPGEAGERASLIPQNAPHKISAEYAAERRDKSGRWEKKPGVTCNELIDLLVYALTLVIVLGIEKFNYGGFPPGQRSVREALLRSSAPPRDNTTDRPAENVCSAGRSLRTQAKRPNLSGWWRANPDNSPEAPFWLAAVA